MSGKKKLSDILRYSKVALKSPCDPHVTIPTSVHELQHVEVFVSLYIGPKKKTIR